MAELPKIAEEAVKKIDSKLECSICLEKFKEPKLLPCFHIFCKSPCLERLVVQGAEGQSLTCPTCRHHVTLPDNGVAGLQTDFHIDHLFEIRESLEKAKKTECDNCADKAASKFCHDCRTFLCDKCLEVHKAWKKNTGQRLIDVNDVKENATKMLAPAQRVLRCTEHSGKKLKIYCESCSELICSDCTIRIHKNHDYDLIKDVYPKHKEELASSLEPLKEKLDKVKHGLEMLRGRITEVIEQKTTVEADIHREIDELIFLLNQRKEELLTDIDSQTQQKLKELATQKDLVETAHAKMSSCLEYAETGLETGSEGEVLRMKGPVLKRIEGITAELDPYSLHPQTEVDIEEIKNEVQPLLKECQTLNKFARGVISTECSYATGDGTKFATTGARSSVEVHPMTKKKEKCFHEFILTSELVDAKTGAMFKCDVSQKNGQHTITYQPVNQERHRLHIKINGEHIKGSPYPISVAPSQKSLQRPMLVMKWLKGPYGVVVNSKGELVTAARLQHCLVVHDIVRGSVTMFGAQSSSGGQLLSPCGVAVDKDNNIYVAENRNNRIQKLTSQGNFICESQRTLNLNHPVGVCYNKTDHLLYVCDQRNHRILVLTKHLTFVRELGTRGDKQGQFQYPSNAALDSGNNLYVTDYGNNRVQIFTAEGEFLRELSKKTRDKELDKPFAIAIGNNDIVYVGEYDRHCVSVFTAQGEYITSFGTKGTNIGQFNGIFGLWVQENNSIVVSDHHNNRVQIFY